MTRDFNKIRLKIGKAAPEKQYVDGSFRMGTECGMFVSRVTIAG